MPIEKTEDWFLVAEHIGNMNTSILKILKGETLEKEVISSYWLNVLKDQVRELSKVLEL